MLFKAINGKDEVWGGYFTGTGENVYIQGFVREGSCLNVVGIDGTKTLKLIFKNKLWWRI